MKTLLVAFLATFLFTACGSNDDSPQAVADKYCDLLEDYLTATTEEEAEAAEEAMDEYQEKIEKDHPEDDAFMEQVRDLADECGDALEDKYGS